MRLHARVPRDDRGSALVEVVVASLILVVAVSGVIGTMGTGMGIVGHSRQRSAASGVAQERLERVHHFTGDAFDDVALSERPTHSTNPKHPNNKVSVDRTTYDGEELIVDETDGGLKHLDDPFTVANTEFTVHQYVTWPDASHAKKRVTVVVTWKYPVSSGTSHQVTEATLVSDGTVAAPAPLAEPPPQPAATGPPSDGPLGQGGPVGNLIGSLGGNGQCLGDTTQPEILEMAVLSGSGTEQGYLNSTGIELRISARDNECEPLDLYLANATEAAACPAVEDWYPVAKMPGQDPLPVNVTWTIEQGDGLKGVCALIRAKDLRPSQVWGLNVKLDQSRPTTPGGFHQLPAPEGCTISTSDRTVTFAWTSSTDANFYGYRLYRSIEGGSFLLDDQTTALSITDVEKKNYSSVRYVLRAYDKAGNESLDSAILSYAKSRC